MASNTSEHHFILPVMMTSAISLEEQLAAMSSAIEKLTKTVEEKDLQIANLMNKLESKKSEESKSAAARHDSKHNQGPIQRTVLQHSHVLEALHKENRQHEDASRLSTAFQQFNGKGNPRQHVAHFIETCNDARTEGDLLLKQFVQSLKGNAFDWYTDLELESLDFWEEMEQEFQNCFYSTRRSTGMMELTNTKQQKEEHVVDYINRWRALSLDCKERLSEASAVEMCMQGMHWELLYILQGNKPCTFEELETRGHNMEITIASHGGNNFPIGDPRKDTREAKWWWGSEATTEDSMIITATSLNIPKKIKGRKKRRRKKPQGKERQQPKFKELEQKVCPFSDSEVPGILDFQLEHKLIDLSKMKCGKRWCKIITRGTASTACSSVILLKSASHSRR
ncbi:hypothetical protein RJ639_002686 [Escallonia herrerae]|uniref:Retrotransposon gag domain-containing protein n=1 Tax=Escallonia herrerae TaxID=1293975 RepID=A0AA88XFB0_9ASTE|nr:hypothetical protein RJ639_002686 [Escallonia herrerae]